MKEHFGNYMLPVLDALSVFSGKWKIPIISALCFYEECTFSELEKVVQGITPRMLSKELRELEENLLIIRTVLPTRPVKIKYEITSYGRTSDSVMTALYDWGQKHRAKIKGKV
mgnify:CR=1 FL=1